LNPRFPFFFFDYHVCMSSSACFKLVFGTALCLLVLDTFLTLKIYEEKHLVRILQDEAGETIHELNLCKTTTSLRTEQLEMLKVDHSILMKKSEALEFTVRNSGCFGNNSNFLGPSGKAAQMVSKKIQDMQFPSNCSSPELRFLVCDLSQAHGYIFYIPI